MGALKVRVGGAWVDAVGGLDEVAIGTDDPIATIPTAQLWYDSDAPALLTDDYRWNTAWGVIGSASTQGFQITPAGQWVDVPGMSVTWTPVVGRRYRTLVTSFVLKGTAGGDIYIRISDAANTQHTGTGATLGINAYASLATEHIDTGLAAVSTIRKAQAYTTSLAGSFTISGYPAWIVVEDMGPMSGFAPAPNPTPSWIPVTFTSPWANYGSIFQPAQYRKIGDIVYVRGMVLRPSGTQAIIFNLPVGYRPAGALQFTQKWFNGAADAPGFTQINTVGDLAAISTMATGTVSALTIDCSFSVSA